MRNVRVRGQHCHSQASNLLNARNECANQNAMRLMDTCTNGKNGYAKKWRNLMVDCHYAICIYSMLAKLYKSTNVSLCPFNKPRSINDFHFVLSKYHVLHWTFDVAWERTNVRRIHCTNWYLSRPFFAKLIFNQSMHFTLHSLNATCVAYRLTTRLSSLTVQTMSKSHKTDHEKTWRKKKSSKSKTISLRRVLATAVFTWLVFVCIT